MYEIHIIFRGIKMEFLWDLIALISLVALIVGLVFRFSDKNKENAEKKKQGKNLAIIGIVALFASGLIMSQIQNAEAEKTKVKGKTVTYKQLNKKISEDKKTKKALSDQIDQFQSNKNDLDSQISDLQNKHKDVMNAIKNKEKLKQQISDEKNDLDNVKSEISESKSKLDVINSKISSAKDALAQASGQVQQAKSAPKTLSAGKYTVGSDVPAGRYKAVPVGEGSNFIVFDDGDPVVNTILGSGGESSYTFEATSGERIQTESAVKLIPLK